MKRSHKVGDIVWYVSEALMLRGVVQRITDERNVIVYFEDEVTGRLDVYPYNIYSPNICDRMVFICGQ